MNHLLDESSMVNLLQCQSFDNLTRPVKMDLLFYQVTIELAKI